jgi:hypothetical protein
MNALRIAALLERAGLPAPTIGMPNEEAWELIANALEQAAESVAKLLLPDTYTQLGIEEHEVKE